MARALALARESQGSTNPNPPVGAVIVAGGAVVGEGRTQPPGGPHAEVMALRAAGAQARGAEIYVTLEPCSHWGRTPPCANALIEAGIAAAHVSLLDPNPLVEGQGIRRLRDHGIAVDLGEGSDAAADLIAAHTVYATKRRPMVTLLLDVPAEVGERETSIADMVLDAAPESTDDVARYLAELARQEVSAVLAPAGSPAGVALLGAGLVDRIVAGRTTLVPAGFTLRQARDEPAPHIVLKPVEGT
jgi:diaminohydroxyphosphoribosylaminopyrimidine deaminase/5-amino-6-(5-phosphoribosylamino)uracil reductase